MIRRPICWTVALAVLAATPLAFGASNGSSPVQVFFNSGEVSPASDSIETLNGWLDQIRQLPPGTIERILVEGYADSRQPKSTLPFDDNLSLSQARARKVADILAAAGLPAEAIEPIGRGAADVAGDPKNSRRVDVNVQFKSPAQAAEHDPPPAMEVLSLSVRDTDVRDIFAMLAHQRKVSILLASGVTGTVSVSLHDVTLDFAIRNIADVAGFVVENRSGAYLILNKEDAGDGSAEGLTVVKSFKVQYSSPDTVKSVLDNYVSSFGKVTALPERKLLVVEDKPDFVRLIATVLNEIDRPPAQVLIEAKILEITLDDNQTFGINWSAIFGDGTLGAQGLAPSGPGLFANIVTEDLELFLNALSSRGRVRTLSTPKLLAVEDQESSVVVGDRIGYRVSTTVNTVTQETIEFLESGVILRVTPHVDGRNRVVLDVHPEVSSGSIADGIPRQATTEVTTRLVAESGETVFIGGLIKTSESQSKSGVPLLQHIPLLGAAFTSIDTVRVNTETVVLITPRILDGDPPPYAVDVQRAREQERDMTARQLQLDQRLSAEFGAGTDAEPSETSAR